MTALRRSKGYSRASELIVRLDRSEYEKQSRSEGVKDMLTRTRRNWLKRYGYDPAAERLKQR